MSEPSLELHVLGPKLAHHKRALRELADASEQYFSFEAERLGPGPHVGDEEERSTLARQRFHAALVRARQLGWSGD